mgnify:FL=1
MDKITKKILLDRALELKALVYGDFTLSSGLKSDFYFDGRLLSMDPQASSIIAKWIIDKSKEHNVTYIGGPAVAAVPLIGATVAMSASNKAPLSGFFVRSDKKDHGTQKQIEGNIKKNVSVVVLDDTISTGGSLFQAINAIEDFGCNISLVLSVLDRNMGGGEKIRDKGFYYESIFEINSKGEFV